MRASAGGREPGGLSGVPATLRIGGPADAPCAASLHAGLITEGFLASLGPKFLTRLYRRITRSEDSFLLIAEAGAGTIGFIAGSVAVGQLYRDFARRDAVPAALSAPLRLLVAWPRVLETLRHGRDHTTAASGGELLAVAVDPAWRGQRVGDQLVAGFLVELGRRGAASARVVVGGRNAAAIAMYERAGFVASRSLELHRGTVSTMMERPVDSPAPPAPPAPPAHP